MPKSKHPLILTAIATLKRAAFNILPAGLVYRLWHRNSRRHPRYLREDLRDRRNIPVQEGAQLYISWADVAGIGQGPAASLYVYDEEVLRLDCFGGSEGHMHLNPEQSKLIMRHGSARIYFEPGPREAHISRAAFELSRNVQAGLLTNKLSRVRDYAFDPDRLSSAASEMSDIMKKMVADRQGQP